MQFIMFLLEDAALAAAIMTIYSAIDDHICQHH